MHADEPHAVQAPLKQQHRRPPDAALITLRARGRLGEGVGCTIDTGKTPVHPGARSGTRVP